MANKTALERSRRRGGQGSRLRRRHDGPKLETIVAHKSRLPRSGLCLRLLQSESLKHKRSAGRLGRRRKLRSLKQSHFLSRFHVDPLGIPQKSWQVMFSLRALCVSSAPSAFTGGLQLCASSVAGGRHTRSGMQNRESTDQGYLRRTRRYPWQNQRRRRHQNFVSRC